MTFSIDINTFILILSGILILLVVTIAVLLRIKKKRKLQEKIPGVEEMAKTTFFWSDYHRGRIGKDE